MSGGESSIPQDAVAIIGMAGRFPGAGSIVEFWRNLCGGVESISSFSVEDLRASGHEGALIARGDYVPRMGFVADSDMFDAGFFGFTPREAELTDPQQRLFLEAAWDALENAACNPETVKGQIGLYAGSTRSDYLSRVLAASARQGALDSFAVLFGNAPEYLVTRTSYKLNLSGPSICINTACSTSLVATALACQGLLNGDCTVAIAGGAAVSCPVKGGYIYEEGGIMSPDGHCRAFDERAQGTVAGNGVGVVVMKRLEDALAAGDNIIAVIRGYAINNDGAHRVGFTAPSIKGQSEVICEALSTAGVSAETITYVEAHGTGTSLGDPIEIEALTQAFRHFTQNRQYCAIGSVKTNIGHLDTAAGVAGLIKTALSLQHGVIPASLHYRAPNPRIDFAASPFFVNDRLREWRSDGPRRAGVSSFGIGGTNAHIVLEEAPRPAASRTSRAVQILPLSARTPTALQQMQLRLADHLELDAPNLADAAYTLAVGRKAFQKRMAVVCGSRAEALERLRTMGARRDVVRGKFNGEYRAVALLLGGQGSQYVGMGRELYEQETVFRNIVADSSEYLKPLLGVDLRQIMHSGPDELLRQTWLTQPALYVLEWALLKQWESWGVRAEALIGHSLGELVAATAAGVLSEEEGLKFVALRGRLMWQTEPGAMLSVSLREQEAQRYVRPGISIAAVNSRQQVVYTGRESSIAELHRELEELGLPAKRLVVERAFHSEMLEQIREEFLREVGELKLRPPQRRFISNVTGTWATEEVTQAGYWWRQMREPVLFAAGVRELSKEQQWVWLELTPSAVLGKLVRTELPTAAITASLRDVDEPTGDSRQMARALGTLWAEGISVDWERYYDQERRQRVPLPTYPFERQHFSVSSADLPASPVPMNDGVPEKIPVPDRPAPTVRPESRLEMLLARIRKVWATCTGMEAAQIDPEATFFELGADSLLLMHVTKVIKDEFGVKLAFRRMIEEFTSIRTLAQHLDAIMPPDWLSDRVTAAKPHGDIAPQSPTSANTPQEATSGPRILVGRSPLVTQPAGSGASEPFVPHQPVRPRLTKSLNERQQRYLAELIRRYNSRTAKSKAHIANHRSHLADNRGIHLFRSQWKDLVYPIVGVRSEGAHAWDLDGNEYVDLTMGFGVHMFGHSPAFVNDALRAQLDQGVQLGPQSHLAGVVARSVSELTGLPRVAFCNSGTEAVMTAIRLARAITGRDRIVTFAGAYHGTFDGTLVRVEKGANGALGTHAAGPGIPSGLVRDVTCLYYDDPSSLDFIRSHAHEIAAVLVEPVQSRRPDVQPREFLHRLRQLTAENGVALIFDDIITGFRIHPGGTQAWFGIQADIATYGKVIAGGMPIGIVAGCSWYLDGIDGGSWQYGDESYPQSDQIVHAGTFSKHPLTMAACHAVTQHLQARGPGLQIELNRRSDRFVLALNRLFETKGVGLRLINCGSIIRFWNLGNDQHLDLLFYNLISRGVYLWEGRTAFLSTVHTDEDLQLVLRAFEQSIEELRTAGFLEAGNAAPPRSVERPRPHRLTETTEQVRQLWALAQRDPASSRAYNESITITARNRLDPDTLLSALRQVVGRHESLRTVFTNDGEFMQVCEEHSVELPFVDLTTEEHRVARLEALLATEAGTLFDLTRGPLFRALLVKLAEDSFVLALTAHHAVFDGWSGGVLLRELSACYLNILHGTPMALPPAMQYFSYIEQQKSGAAFASVAESREFWMRRFASGVPRLELPTRGDRPPVYTYAGGREHVDVPAEVAERIKELAACHSRTQFVVLLAAYAALLARLSTQEDLTVGIHAAGQAFTGGADLIGHCVNLVPLWLRVDLDASFLDLIDGCQRECLDTSEHQLYQYGELARDLCIKRDPSRLTLVETVFNLDYSPDNTELFGMKVEIGSSATGSSKWDLSWNVVDSGKHLRVQCDYNVDLYRGSDVRDWLEEFGGILDIVSRSANVRLGQLMAMLDEKAEETRAARRKAMQAARLERLETARRETVRAGAA